MSIKEYAIHWFRRDLRVAGNQALKVAHKKCGGRVLGFFCFDKEFLSRPDLSFDRFQFFIETLVALKKELNQIGGDLLVLDKPPEQAFKYIFEQLGQYSLELPSLVTYCRDYEPFAVNRDKRLDSLFSNYKISSENFRDHLLIEPNELHKDDKEKSGYQVYSPFARKWLKLMDTPLVKKRIDQNKRGFEYLEGIISGEKKDIFNFTWKQLFDSKVLISDRLSEYREENLKKVKVPIPLAGSQQAFKELKSFAQKLNDYGVHRDIPSLLGTSRMSTYLKNGSITVPQIICYFKLQTYQKKKSGRDTYLSELIWREFYYHIMARHPRVEKEEFLGYYKDLEWENNEDYFQKWTEGKTGFPIVDAGMRELNTTGWMHNRVRMIVASFLTKDLLIDWKWGEKYFMERLLDGDLAPNNGGWQWAASTGCDPQPYFRIFNPWLQSKRFDPKADYIKKYVPELRDLSEKEIHQPILGHSVYPAPIVDHKEQRELALKMYKKAREANK